MNYLLVPDKFKGSLSAEKVIEALKAGIGKADPEAQYFSALVSDGGDGFLESIAHYTAAEPIYCQAQGPLGDELQAYYLYDQHSRSAYIEMAKTAGLELLKSAERDPKKTSTYGTGLQLKHAIENGAEKIYVGLGGSATNDAGIGIATAMGYSFLNDDQKLLEPVGENLTEIGSIIPPENLSLLERSKVYAVNDVNNPLYGPEGAAYVYAAQKGGDAASIEYLDQGLRKFELLVQNDLNKHNGEIPGAGAAGGTAYGLMTFLNAEFIGGTEFILQLAGVPGILENEAIDYIITGEGKIDNQTLRGKLIHGILDLGKNARIPVLAICGALDADEVELREAGLKAAIEVQDRSRTLEYNMKNAANLVEQSISNYFKGIVDTKKN